MSNKINRELVLSDEINNSSIKSIIEQIIEINIEDDKNQKEIVGFERKPIKFFVNTNGGSIYSGLALIVVMNKSKTPIYTYCLGMCFSMGLPVFLNGIKRKASKYSTFMIHDAISYCYDKIKQIDEDLNESKRIRQIVIDIILEKTDITKKQIDEIIKKKENWYIDGNEAKKLKIVDEIL